jgi:hypothetical protein
MLGKDFTSAAPNQPLDPLTRDLLARDDFSELNSADPLVDVSRPIAKWLSAGKKIPILMLSHNRGSLLRKSIVSLTTTVRGATADNIFIAQDGHDAECLAIAKEFGIRSEIHDNPHVSGPPWKVGAVKIARHYKWAFSKLFDHLSTDAPAVIVVEDDLLYAPDFLDYFHAVAPLVEVDDTLWAASSWNDNGFDYLVKEPHALYRTGFFPGLGWLMTRELWAELQHKWPQEHWDHWLRQHRQHKGREVLFPAMPRVFHNGVKGTFMDRKTHEKYFARIATNRDATIKWRVPKAYGGGSDGSQGEIASGKHMDPWVRAARNLAYEARIKRLLTSPATRHVSDPGGEIPTLPAGSSVAIWVNIDVSRDHPNPFKPVGQFFGIWHEAKRGAFRGVHEFWANGGETHVLLVNVHPSVKENKPKGVVHSSFAGYLPSGYRALPGNYFQGMPPFPRKASGALQMGFHGDEVYNPEKEKVAAQRARRL